LICLSVRPSVRPRWNEERSGFFQKIISVIFGKNLAQETKNKKKGITIEQGRPRTKGGRPRTKGGLEQRAAGYTAVHCGFFLLVQYGGEFFVVKDRFLFSVGFFYITSCNGPTIIVIA
jgi:hypothetical protein